MRIEISPDYATLRPHIEALANQGLPDDATVIYSGRNTIATFERDGVALCVKAFARPKGLRQALAFFTPKSKAHKAFDNARRLLDAGIDTPAPVAWAETPKGNYYICLQSRAVPLRDIDGTDRVLPALPAVARVIDRLWHAGILFNDFTPGNILIDERDDDTEPGVTLVDINRLECGVTSPRRLRAMLNSPSYSDLTISRILDHLAEISGKPRQRLQTDFIAARRAYNRRKRLTHPLRYRNRPAR